MTTPFQPARARQPIIHVLSHAPAQSGLLEELREVNFQVDVFTEPQTYPDFDRTKAGCPDLLWLDGEPSFLAFEGTPGTVIGMAASQDIPVLVTSSGGSLDMRLAAHRAGVTRYLRKPVSAVTLLSEINELLGRGDDETLRAMLVAEPGSALSQQAAGLEAGNILIRVMSERDSSLPELEAFAPDVIVIPEQFHGIAAQELTALIREHGEWSDTPIVLASDRLPCPQNACSLPTIPTVSLKELPEALPMLAADGRLRRNRESSARQIAYERQKEHEVLDQHAIVSIADRRGEITYVNDLFCEISGYARRELIGENHRLLKSGTHPPGFYKEMWQTIARGRTWHGDICNRRKDGSHYWVRSTIAPMLDEQGKPYQYISLRTDITHVKAIEGSLRQFRNTLDQTLDCVFIFDAETLRFTYANQGAIEQVGYSLDELHDMHPYDIKPNHDHESLQSLLAPLKAGSEHRLEFRTQHEHKDGHFVPVEISIQHIELPNERARFIAIVRDITERLRHEAEIERNRERLRRGQIAANIGTWDWNIQTGDLYWSERIAPLFGYPEGTLDTSFDNFLAALHPDDKQSVLDAIDRAITADEPYEVEHRVIWPDGTVRWLLEKGAVQKDEHNRPLHMMGVVQDIHDRKEAEAALAESRTQLIEAQALAQVGSWRANVVTGELDWSDEIFRIFGHVPHAITPSVERFFEAVHPDDRDLVRQSELEAQDTGRHDVKHRIVRSDGTIRYVHELAAPEFDEQGRLVAFTGTVQDITESVKAEQALIKAREEAEAASRTKSEFLSSMSHELRTPLNAVLGFGQLLEYDDELSGDHKDSIREIIKAGQHLLDLINDVLDLAKIESGKVDLSIEPVEAGDVIEDCLKLIEHQAGKRDISVSHEGLAHAVVSADRVRLKQALLNLLSNAIKYNHPGGSIRLTASMHPDEPESLRIVVSDTGVGIPLHQQRHLFEPFNRLGAEKSAVEGTGIGLAITRQTVEMMGGSVGFASTPGEGSQFWIALPVESLPTDRQPAAATSDSSPAEEPSSNTSHMVLYIEDNPANLKLVASLLSRHPHIQMLSAQTSELGLESASLHRPELILLDINMPDLDGYQVLERIKSDDNLADIPVIAITANAMPQDIQRGLDAGFADYLTKPLDITRFQRIIDKRLLPPGHGQ